MLLPAPRLLILCVVTSCYPPEVDPEPTSESSHTSKSHKLTIHAQYSEPYNSMPQMCHFSSFTLEFQVQFADECCSRCLNPGLHFPCTSRTTCRHAAKQLNYPTLCSCFDLSQSVLSILPCDSNYLAFFHVHLHITILRFQFPICSIQHKLHSTAAEASTVDAVP